MLLCNEFKSTYSPLTRTILAQSMCFAPLLQIVAISIIFTQSILDLNPSQTDSHILDAGILLADYFYSDRPISKLNLAQAMNEAFGGTDANNCWRWKWAWETLEVAQILFLRRFSLTSLTLEFVETILKLCPIHSIRNAEMDKFQQF